MKGKSRCDSCGHELSLIDLIPLISYVLHKGKCRFCGKRLSLSYPLIELTGGAVYLAIFLKKGLTSLCLIYCLLFSILLCISLTDIMDYLVPGHLAALGVLTVMLLHMAMNVSIRYVFYRLSGSLFICLVMETSGLIMKKMLGREALGGGDILVLFILGNCFSLSDTLMGMVLSCAFGIIYASFSHIKDKEIPFVPFISLAFFILFLVK